MMSDFAPVCKLNSSKVAPNPKIAHSSVRAYCVALLSDADCLESEIFTWYYRQQASCLQRLWFFSGVTGNSQS